MISHEHRAIFIHIPKTAGTSIEQKLGLFATPFRNAQDHRTVREVRPLSLVHQGKYLLNPIPLMNRKAIFKEMFGLPTEQGQHGRRATKEEFAKYFKFAVVRNPWARVYSWYRNVMRDPLHGIPPCDFPTFLVKHGDNWALLPQTHWLKDFDGTIPLNRVVRFENLQEEMTEVLVELGFDDPTLPHLLAGSHGSPYRSAYDSVSVALVAKRYEEEIKLFGYKF